jgi:hypothetical protein
MTQDRHSSCKVDQKQVSCDFAAWFPILASSSRYVQTTFELYKYSCRQPLHLLSSTISLTPPSFPIYDSLLYILSCFLNHSALQSTIDIYNHRGTRSTVTLPSRLLHTRRLCCSRLHSVGKTLTVCYLLNLARQERLVCQSSMHIRTLLYMVLTTMPHVSLIALRRTHDFLIFGSIVEEGYPGARQHYPCPVPPQCWSSADNIISDA